MMNSQLFNLYNSNWGSISRVRQNHNLTAPLLMKLEEKKVKLFVVGQETLKGWSETSVEDCLKDYEACFKCLMSEKINESCKECNSHNSPFWRTVRDLKSKIVDPKKECVAWNNLNRMSKKGKKPEEKIELEMIEKFPLLSKEFKICNPQIAIFFTGPNYDDLIKKTFQNVVFNKLNDEFSEKELAKLSIPVFDFQAYRTYHPAHLWRNPKKYGKCGSKILDSILENYKTA